MAKEIEARIAELGIVLPEAPSPAGSYVPCRRAGSLLYAAGQLSVTGDRQVVGKVGRDLDVDAAREAARLCGLNILSQLRKFCGGSLDGIAGCVELRGYVNAVPEFADHPAVLNGASDLMLEVFGESGRHARAAVGTGSLPRGVAVEVAGLFELAPE